MNRTDLHELIANGEDSRVEFKRDEVEPHRAAEDVVAFANLEGGVVLLGVEDDGTISGTTRENLEEWAVQLCRANVDPPLIPTFRWVRDAEDGKDVAVLQVVTGPNKPYWHVRRSRRRCLIRIGSTNRECSDDELQRLYQASGRLIFGAKPVPGATFDDLDLHRLRDYFASVRDGDAPSGDSASDWTDLLVNLDLMVGVEGTLVPTVDGILLFGRKPNKFLPQSGIRALVYPGATPDYATQADENLRGPMVPLLDREGGIVENGLVEQALGFVRRNTSPEASLEGGRRVDRMTFPAEVLREAMVNALVHRDYSIYGTDILFALFEDRLEITSPGRLPNTVTVDGLRAGLRYARNQNLVNVMRDYNYVEARGMGIRDKMIPGMREFNGTEPEFEEQENSFVVRLRRSGPQGTLL